MKKKILFFIFLLAAILRLLGTNPGYPLTHPDEPGIYESVRNIVIDYNFKPFTYYYGSLLPNIYASVDFIYLPIEYSKFFVQEYRSISNSGFKNINDKWLAYLDTNKVIEYWSRYETAILSSLAVVAIYILTLNLFNWRVGLISSYFTAVNYRHVLSSVFSLADAPLSFFVIISIYLSYKIIKKPSIYNYLLAALGVGLTLSVKYFIYTIPTFLICHIIASFNNNINLVKKIKNVFCSKKIWLALLLTFLTFIIINPYIILDYSNANSQFTYNLLRYGVAKDQIYNLNWIFKLHIKSFLPIDYLFNFGLGKVLSISAILGFIISIIKYPKQTLILLSTLIPFLYFFLFISGTTVVRNYSSIIPLLLIYPAIFADWILDRLKNLSIISQYYFKAIAVTTIVILGGSSFLNSFKLSYSLSQKRNLDQAKLWIDKNIPVESKIIQVWQSPLPPHHTSDYWNPSIESFKSISQISDDKYQWLIMNSEITTYLNNLNVGAIPQIVRKESYLNLITEEYASYRVKTFDKNIIIAADPSYFVSKIPDFSNMLYGKTKFLFRNTETNPCRQNFEKQSLGKYDSEKQKFYIVSGQVKKLAGDISRTKNGFIRMNFLDKNNHLLKSYVSQILQPNKNLIQNFNIYGIAPAESEQFELFFQRDDCYQGDVYKILNVKLSILEKHPFNINDYPYYFSKLPDNFIWTPPL